MTTTDFFADRPPARETRDPFARDFFDAPPDPALEGIERPERDEDEIPRAKNGRPYIWAVDDRGEVIYQGVRNPKPKLVTYTRTTTFAKTLEDTTNLSKWAQRMTAIGVASNPDIQLSILSHPHVKMDRNALNQDVEDAKERAKASAQARVGTALHALTERYDLGLEIGFVPEAYRADLRAYIEATRFFEMVHIERFVVLDDWKIGGTPDRCLRYRPCGRCGGIYYIGDLKTGDIYFGADAIAIQLAIYAHGRIYNRHDGSRMPWPEGLCLCKAVVIHLPQGEGVCRLEWTNIDAGWRTMELARQVREHRAKKDWSVGFDPLPTSETLHAYIQQAKSREEALGLHEQYRAAWTPEHTEAARGLWGRDG